MGSYKTKIKIIFYTIIFCIFLFINQVSAATTTITYTQTATDIGGGSFSWTNPNNATGNTTNTSASSTINTRNAYSNYLSLTNFNLAGAGLPIGAVINGIQVDVERNVSNTRVRDTTVQLTSDGVTPIGSNYGLNANGPTAKTITTYGGLTDMWGTSLTVNDLLSSSFGVILQYQNTFLLSNSANVYRVAVTIDYTPNNPPTDISLSNQSIASGMPIGTYVGTLSTTDADITDTHSYSLTCSTPGADDSSFNISGSDLVSNEVFDYTIKSSYNICIRTDDARGGTFDKNFTINITPPIPNNPPTDIVLSNQSIYEGLAIGSLVGSLSTVDPDTIDSHTYSFTCSTPGADDSSFNISGSDLVSNEVFNYSIKTNYDICIRTDDGRGGTFDKNFTITILQNLDLRYAHTATDIGGGSFSWTNPNNATLNTTTTSANVTINTRNTSSNILSLTNFGLDALSIPSNANIDGIQVDVERMVDNTRITDSLVQLTKDGINPVGNNYGLNANGPTTKSITTYGSLIDNWGAGLTPADINSPNFGVLLQYTASRSPRTASVYRVKMTIAYSIPSSPGGVTGMSLWLKADVGTSTTTDQASLSTWLDQSGNGYDATAGVAPTYINNDTENLNYNPVVNFDGTQYMDNLNNGGYSSSYYTVIIPSSTVDGTISGEVPFGFDCESGILSTGTCGLPFSGITLGAFTVAINDEVITHAIGSSTSWRSSQIGSYSYEAGRPMLIGANENSTADGTDLYEKGLKVDNYTANTYQTLSSADYRIGMSMDANNPFPYTGKIAEVIDYTGRLTDLERQKIESYLALKYGVTLNSGNQDYIASDGITYMWNSSFAGAYNYDIFGIGRDNASSLSQIKSKSSNAVGVVTIEAIGEGTNINPSFVDIDDLDFLTISNNNAGNVWTAIDSPSGYYNLSRLWKTQETGELGTLNINFDVGNTNFDIPNLSTGTNYFFTYDSNNNGLLSDETPISMTNISGNIWQVSSINLNNGQIFTITTQASTNNIPTDIILSNNSVNENVPAGTNIGTLSSVDVDSGDTHTYTLVAGAGDTDNSYFSISGNNLNIEISPDYELKNQYNIRVQTDDGNGGIFQKTFIIYINNLAETIDTIIDFEDIGDESKYSVTSGTWTRTTNNPYEGLYSIESGNNGIANSQSCFEITNTLSSTGTISFYYNVDSQANGDYLRFYIDNIEQQAWSGTVPWANYSQNNINTGAHTYKWCYIKDNATNTGNDKAWIDYITINSINTDLTPPDITSINYSSGSLLPGGNHNIIITYNDSDSGIDVTSDIISLYKWDGVSSWGTDISSSGFDLGSKTITTTNATYPTNNLSFGKYRYDFSISDIESNTSSTGAIFYIDEPELIISTGAVDIGNIKSGSDYFSPNELDITVKTVGAGFNLILNKVGPVVYDIFEIVDYNGTTGIGYDKSPYSSTIHKINTNEIIATQSGNINTDGNKNSYLYKIRMGASVGEEQAAGNYNGSLEFKLDMDY